MEQKQIPCGSVLPVLSPKYQWLVSQEGETDDQVFFSLQDPHSHYRCRIPQLVGKHIRACFHGWVILSNHVAWSLWDPQTSRLIHLPPLIHNEDEYFSVCLTCPPDDPGSVLLLSGRGKPTFVFCRLSDKLRWNEMSYSRELTSIIEGGDSLLNKLTYCNGKVYALCSNADDLDWFVIQIDILVNKDQEEEVKITLSPLIKCPSGYGPAHCEKVPVLIEFGSNLLVFYEYFFESCLSSIYLSKLDLINMSWEEMKDLNDIIVFVDNDLDSVFNSYAIASSEFGGYIHFLCDKGKVILSYNVNDKAITTRLLDLSSGSRRRYVSAWAMAECRSRGDNGELEFGVDSKQEEANGGGELVVNGEDAYNKITRNQQQNTESHLFNIPFHVLEMIMVFFADVDYVNFRATCKYLAAPVVELKEATIKRRSYSPWLMFFDNDKGIITFTDPMFGDMYFIKTPEKLIGDFRIHYSKNGWLLMSKDTGEVMLYNPFTSDIRELPHPQVTQLETLFFSSPPSPSPTPSSPVCMVVGLMTKGEWQIYLHGLGQQIWYRLHVDYEGATLSSYSFPIFYNQHIFALQDDGGLYGYIILEDERKVDWGALVRQPPGSWKKSAEYFLVKRDETVLLVVCGPYGESIEVFMLKVGAREWEKVDNLGSYMICISPSTCICVEAKIQEMANKIFLPCFHSKNEKILFYSLETCKFHTFDGKYIQGSYPNESGTKHRLGLQTWIEPGCF